MKIFLLFALLFTCFRNEVRAYNNFEITNTKVATINQPSIDIPVVREVDALVIGATTAAIQSAVEMSQHNLSVIVMTSKPYLGEDICSTLDFQAYDNQDLDTELAQRLFCTQNITPLQIKSRLLSFLEENSVEVLFSSYPTDLLLTTDNEVVGVAIGNRAGRQFIKTKVVIDATKRADVCRMSGAESYPFSNQKQQFYRNLISVTKGDTLVNKRMFEFPVVDFSFSELAEIEQKTRDLTSLEDVVRSAESLMFISPDAIKCKKSHKNYKNIELDYFQTKISDQLFVLGECADIPRSVAETIFSNYPKAIKLGRELGSLIAQFSITIGYPNRGKVANKRSSKRPTLFIAENCNGLRPTDDIEESITIPMKDVPVWGNYDVIVVGGGTSGSAAAIAAAKQGAKVVVVEYLEGLGGMGTLGMIGKPYFGKKSGFAATVPFPDSNIEVKMEWYRSMLRMYNADIWFGCTVSGAIIKDKTTVAGVIVLNSDGRGALMGKTIIDATGNGDVAIVAGAEYMYGEIENGDIALQGSGMPSRPLNSTYYNSDYLLVDDVDMVDVTNTLIGVQQVKAQENQYDAGTLIQTRERRRIIGEEIISYMEQIAGRGYEDVVVYSHSDYDSHGYPSLEYFALLPHDSISAKKNHPAPGGDCYTPFRALIPKGMNGILVVGTAISMERDATALVRMQYDITNQGYAAGYAAALAANENVPIREVSIKKVQEHLVEIGNLPDNILDDYNNFPLSKENVAKSVKEYAIATNPEMAGKPLAIILTHSDIAIPMLVEEFNKGAESTKLACAKILGVFGKSDGVEVLLNELEKYEKWDDKILQGAMACYAHLPTPKDQIITSLSSISDSRVLPALIAQLKSLDANTTLSHHFAIAKGVEKIGDKEACRWLYELLKKEGMSGYAITSNDELKKTLHNNGKNQLWRTNALREIVIARALYRCGDYNGLGEKILKQYQNDIRGLFARHSKEVISLP